MQVSTITLEGEEFPIAIKRHATAKRYTLRYDGEQELIKLTIPKRASIKGGLEFTASRANWLFGQMHKVADRTELAPGAEFPLLGLNTLLAHEAGRGMAELDESEQPQTLTIRGGADFFNSRLKRYLSRYLKEFITPIANEYAGTLGVKFKKVSIRDTKTHWGSCTPDGNLSFAFRLVFAEPEIVDYIVAHEVAHLRELNHSKDFWQLTEQLCPDYKTHRKWLKEHGSELERFVV